MGIPASLILEVPELMNEPQVHHRQMIVEKDGYRGLGIPIKMSRTPGAVQMAPPRFGAHTRAILADNGFSPEEGRKYSGSRIWGMAIVFVEVPVLLLLLLEPVDWEGTKVAAPAAGQP